jgi:hypothetical protein
VYSLDNRLYSSAISKIWKLLRNWWQILAWNFEILNTGNHSFNVKLIYFNNQSYYDILTEVTFNEIYFKIHMLRYTYWRKQPKTFWFSKWMETNIINIQQNIFRIVIPLIKWFQLKINFGITGDIFSVFIHGRFLTPPACDIPSPNIRQTNVVLLPALHFNSKQWSMQFQACIGQSTNQ